MLYVTHDQIEALSLADDIVIMRDGRAVDAGPATALYRQPPSTFTASFLGDANLVPAVVADTGSVRAGPVIVRCPTGGFHPGDHALLCLRPHELTVADGWAGRLTAVQWRGATYRLSVATDGRQLRVDVADVDRLPPVGAAVSVAPVAGAGVLVAV
jgi:2-aminoethylphosphonate transport system ATP-binding protein